MPTNVLIVSASALVREALAGLLRADGAVVTMAESWDEATEVVRRMSVDTVLIETRSANARARRLRERLLQLRPGTRVVLLTSFDQLRTSTALLQFGQGDYVMHGDQLPELIRSAGEVAPDSRAEVERGTGALVKVIDVLVGLLELGHKHFGGSSHQTMRLARAVAEELNLDEDTTREVVLATLLRDIGKVGIDGDVFEQGGELTDEQRGRMEQHVEGSVRLLEHIDFPWKVLLAIRHHHERYDGKGYPDGLKGREIPIGSRIVGAVDAYVAMISERSHRTAHTLDEALAEIERGAGAQFDPEVAEVLLRVVDQNRARGARLQNPLVLLCEPDAEFRRLFKMKLVNEGFDVQAVKSIRVARRRLSSATPDAIVVSMGSDGEQGFRLLREVRADTAIHHLPFVMLADAEDRIVKVRALREGADDYLAKSADLEELVARVHNVVAREATRRDGASSTRRSGITGQIASLPLPEIVQTLAIGTKTACVSLVTEEVRGKIWFVEGLMVHAETGGAEGEAALYEMLRWKEGEFVIRHGIKSPKTTIDKDPMYVILEGLRLIDEGESRQASVS